MLRLPPDLIEFLHDRGITTISQIVDLGNSIIFMQSWKSTTTLDMHDQWLQEWEGYINSLSESHVHISNDEDELMSAPTAHGVYSPKEVHPITHVA